jgi:large subunit ribosomal protein L15
MKLHTLKPAEGSNRTSKRVGRGIGSGKGRTSTRGHKGAKSRSGYSSKRAFEGGQMPLQMRLPKRGFKNINRVNYVAFNLDRLQRIAEKHNLTMVDVSTLAKLNLISKNEKVKVLASGEITMKLDVQAHAFSATAKQAIEALGGAVTEVK